MTPHEIAEWLDEQIEGDGKYRGEAMEEAADMLRSPLIAAAPDMLDALQSIANGDTMPRGEAYSYVDVIHKYQQIASKTITLATGK